jgi:hypothetical protein
LRLVPSSGSTTAAKLIPYTSTLQAEFARGLGAWIAELYRNRPGMLGGLAYWSISPAIPFEIDVPSAVPVGFEDDSAYVGGILGRAMAATLAVGPVVSQIRDIDAFRYATVLELLRARQLALVSVWHPSFLTLLFEALTRHWDDLLLDMRSGKPSADLEDSVRAALTTKGDVRRAEELASLGPGAWTDIWPNLRLVSCWADAHAAGARDQLAGMLPGVELQPKGLLATEAFATLPYSDGWPVAARSHFFEFIDAAERPRLLHELDRDEEYSLVVSTGGGLYRYRLHDRVRVVGFVDRTPSLRFVGKEDRLSDRFGEKLDDGFVGRVLRARLAALSESHFAMLAPDERGETVGYTLYVETRDASVTALAPTIDVALSENPHYRYCRELGQLAPLRIFVVQEGGHATYVDRCVAAEQRLGDIKPAGLSADSGWSERFVGSYVKEDGPSTA